jgi:hypothetical protein
MAVKSDLLNIIKDQKREIIMFEGSIARRRGRAQGGTKM